MDSKCCGEPPPDVAFAQTVFLFFALVSLFIFIFRARARVVGTLCALGVLGGLALIAAITGQF